MRGTVDTRIDRAYQQSQYNRPCKAQLVFWLRLNRETVSAWYGIHEQRYMRRVQGEQDLHQKNGDQQKDEPPEMFLQLVTG
mgnify:CR=1 FL=1